MKSNEVTIVNTNGEQFSKVLSVLVYQLKQLIEIVSKNSEALKYLRFAVGSLKRLWSGVSGSTRARECVMCPRQKSNFSRIR